MTKRLPGLVAALAVSGLLACRPSLSAMSGGELAAAEAAIRQLDAKWAAAANTASVDAWMAFYTDDAVVLAPDVQISRDREQVRQTVAELLALPHLSIAWQPIKVEVAAAGDLAYLIGAYELSYDGARARVSDRGKLLEIWKRQADGSWKCIVDTWNSNGPAPAAQSARAGGVERGLSAAPEASPAAADPAAAPRPSPSALTAEYGEMPKQYEEAVRQYFEKYLKDPDSVQYQEITAPEKGYATTVKGAIFAREARLRGWTVKATINARNSHGVYVGLKTYTFLFRGEKIVHTVSPLPEDEMK